MTRLLHWLDVAGIVAIAAMFLVIILLVTYEVTLRRKERHQRRLIARLERHYLEDA